MFLLQAQGKRNWKIGQMCNSESPLLQHADLRILAEFEESAEWVLEPGDMLYLPPRLAHFGIAEDDCMTYSVGFRAPSAAEVLTHFTTTQFPRTLAVLDHQARLDFFFQGQAGQFRYNIENPYEKLKELTRGKGISPEALEM